MNNVFWFNCFDKHSVVLFLNTASEIQIQKEVKTNTKTARLGLRWTTDIKTEEKSKDKNRNRTKNRNNSRNSNR